MEKAKEFNHLLNKVQFSPDVLPSQHIGLEANTWNTIPICLLQYPRVNTNDPAPYFLFPPPPLLHTSRWVEKELHHCKCIVDFLSSMEMLFHLIFPKNSYYCLLV